MDLLDLSDPLLLLLRSDPSGLSLPLLLSAPSGRALPLLRSDLSDH